VWLCCSGKTAVVKDLSGCVAMARLRCKEAARMYCWIKISVLKDLNDCVAVVGLLL
jgi:hypothetical protein